MSFYCLSSLMEAAARLPKCYITLSGPMVTIRTTSLTFSNSTFCPHTVFTALTDWFV